MTLARDIVQGSVIGVSVSDTPEGLSAIQDPGCD